LSRAPNQAPLTEAARVAAGGLALAILAFATGWVFVGLSLTGEPGEPCTGRAVNAVQLVLTAIGFTAAVIGVVGVFGYPELGARWLKRGALATGICFCLWLAVIGTGAC
jgi:hypothetical protein